MSEEIIQHHGIKGQQWGIRNGPPYPLDPKLRRKVKQLAVQRSASRDDRDSNQTVGYNLLQNMTVGELKGAHRANVEKIMAGNGTKKEITALLEKENAQYRKALQEKGKLDAKLEQDRSSDSNHSGNRSKKIAFVVGGIAVASIVAYGVYRSRGELGKRNVQDILKQVVKKDGTIFGEQHISDILDSRATAAGRQQVKEMLDGKTTTYLGKNEWVRGQVEKGLIGSAKTFADAREADIYNTSHLFDAEAWGALNEAEKNAIKNYTGFRYRTMNDFLRGIQQKMTSEMKAKNLLDIEFCTDALEKMHLKEDIFVHRGVDGSCLPSMLKVDAETLSSPQKLKKLIGARFVEKGFMSTGGSESDAIERIDSVSLHIFCPKGTKGMYVDPISFFTGEHEFLLQRNTQLQIHDFKLNEGGKITDLMLSVVDQVIDDITDRV